MYAQSTAPETTYSAGTGINQNGALGQPILIDRMKSLENANAVYFNLVGSVQHKLRSLLCEPPSGADQEAKMQEPQDFVSKFDYELYQLHRQNARLEDIERLLNRLVG